MNAKFSHRQGGRWQDWIWIIGGLLAGIALDTQTAFATSLGQEEETQRILPVLMPLLTASVSIERAIEVIWNYMEWILLNSKRWQPADLKAAQYLQFKSGTSMLLGVIFGILVSNFTGMRLFSYMGPLVPNFLEDVPSSWDTVITGIIIGAGAKPAHEILGIITQVKNFFNNAAINQREAAGANFAAGVQRLSESEKQMMVDVPGVGPARLPSGGPVPMGASMPEGEESESAEPEQSQVEKYREILQRATVI
ncbi:hypothetical protein KFU94_20100 [Chloroflexi bacterium TSY]|nr:hypothetical protein [Chloroflexi bacterium TSY]